MRSLWLNFDMHVPGAWAVRWWSRLRAILADTRRESAREVNDVQDCRNPRMLGFNRKREDSRFRLTYGASRLQLASERGGPNS